MVDKPIPLLPEATFPLDGTELTEITQNGNSRRTPISKIALWDAPVDGIIYARFNGAWTQTVSRVEFDSNNVAIASALAGKVPEAPNDGEVYVRRNLAWQVQTPATLLTDIKTVDGSTSGLDADLLDGQHGPFYLDRANHTGTQAIATIAGLQPALDLKAPLASPALTGNPTAPTPVAGDNDTSIATTAYVQTEIAVKAPINNPAFTGNPTAPTPGAGDADTSIATTAFVTGAITTSDAAQAAALALKADINSPVLTGDPRAPTPGAADNDTSIATTAYVTGAVATSDAAQAAALALKAPLASPVFTGNPTAPTPAAADNDTSIPTTAWVQTEITNRGYATIASPVFTGNPQAPTPAVNDNDTSIATTAFVTAADTVLKNYVDAADALKAPLASPVFTGNPTAPTPAGADNDTSVATTAFVQGAVANRLTDAPSDGVTYGRRNAAWFATAAGLADAAADGTIYARKDGAWINVDPVGQIIVVPANVAPINFLKLNGVLLNRVTYAGLWAYAQASGNIVSEATWAAGNQGAFSTGDLATTFRIPDDRGIFYRNWDDSRGLDSGRVIGAFQDEAIGAHAHTAQQVAAHNHKITTSQPYSSGTPALNNTGTGTGDISAASSSKISFFDGVHTPVINATSGVETRPINHARLACIRYQ